MMEKWKYTKYNLEAKLRITCIQPYQLGKSQVRKNFHQWAVHLQSSRQDGDIMKTTQGLTDG